MHAQVVQYSGVQCDSLSVFIGPATNQPQHLPALQPSRYGFVCGLVVMLHAFACCCAYRAAGCSREALAVAATRLMPADPLAQHIRQRFVNSITPTAAVVQPAAADAGPAGAPTPAAEVEQKRKAHPAAAAANLLLLDQPAAAARTLLASAGGSSVLALHAAARVAALAAYHKVGTCYPVQAAFANIY